jgi:hypothetical protein
MSKLTHNRKILKFQTAVLAEPSDHSRLGQNSKNFFLYKTQPHCVGLVRKGERFLEQYQPAQFIPVLNVFHFSRTFEYTTEYFNYFVS